jgi:hypothetical protein
MVGKIIVKPPASHRDRRPNVLSGFARTVTTAAGSPNTTTSCIG